MEIERMAQYKKYSDLQEAMPKPAENLGLKGTDTKVVQVANPTHRENIISQNKVVLLDMFAPWCGPCTAVAPQIEALAMKYNKQGICAIIKEDVDNKLPQLLGTPPVRGVPTFLFFKNGTFVDSIVGGGIDKIEAKLGELLSEYIQQEPRQVRPQHIEAGGPPPQRQSAIRRER
jgi:thioredoxin 1